ncbi:hypothetical protein B0O79_3538 [Flavobacteriaceae bacterium MAR_2009_75]|nr:hypothetical protein B0O79_3538 [Flavobacteriaceae bacterium MAR_2009_75]
METQEIRWFDNRKLSTIEDKFTNAFEGHIKSDKRVDRYLSTSCSDINIKVREGKLEIKKRTSTPRSRVRIGNCNGYLENWIKWEVNFNADMHSPHHWSKVEKERNLVFLDERGNIVKPSNSNKPRGLQIEYTKLMIDSTEFFSFALEWSVEKCAAPCKLLEKILDGTDLTLKKSMGYTEFLGSTIEKPLAVSES